MVLANNFSYVNVTIGPQSVVLATYISKKNLSPAISAPATTNRVGGVLALGKSTGKAIIRDDPAGVTGATP
jgi:hypothetical protein